jgi:hypothetical protein
MIQKGSLLSDQTSIHTHSLIDGTNNYSKHSANSRPVSENHFGITREKVMLIFQSIPHQPQYVHGQVNQNPLKKQTLS